MDKKTKDINLLMMYINSWEEESRIEPDGKILRAWKGYPFEVLNELEKDKLIRQYAKSVIFTKEGLAKAEVLMRQYMRT